MNILFCKFVYKSENIKVILMEDSLTGSGRFRRTELSELAVEVMFRQIRDYCEVHEIYPRHVVISGREFPNDYCALLLRAKLAADGIESKVFTSFNGEKGDMTFNLDEIAESCDSSKGCLEYL